MKMIRTIAAVAAFASVLSACSGGGTSDVGEELGLTNPEIHSSTRFLAARRSTFS